MFLPPSPPEPRLYVRAPSLYKHIVSSEDPAIYVPKRRPTSLLAPYGKSDISSENLDSTAGSALGTLCFGDADPQIIILAHGFWDSSSPFRDAYQGLFSASYKGRRRRFSLWDVGVEYEKKRLNYQLHEVLKAFNAFIPPAKGEKGEGCGERLLEFFCPNCGYSRKQIAYCKKATCPKCGKFWIKKATARITARLEALRRYKQSFSRKHIRMHHLVLSPPTWEEIRVKNLNPKAIADALFRKAAEILRRCGIKDFVIIFHPYRLADTEIWDLKSEGRAWKNALNDNWREKVKVYPHFHVFVAEHFVGSGKRVYENFGWILKRVTKSRVSIFDIEDLAKQVYYCLSHAGLLENRQFTPYRYYGRIKTLKIPDEVKKDAVGCSHVAEHRIGIYESPSCNFHTVFYPFLALICPRCGSRLIPKPPPRDEN